MFNYYIGNTTSAKLTLLLSEHSDGTKQMCDT